VPARFITHRVMTQDHGLEKALDIQLIKLAAPAIERGEHVEITLPLRNVNRTVGTMLSSELARRYGDQGLPEDTIQIHFTGSAGQSLGAFGAKGLTIEIEGDANDYFGKGLSGGKLIIRSPKQATFIPEQNIIIGNVAFYGATSGEGYIRGLAGERFCVRNSGAHVVVEGVGDHGCEYMTGGRVVVLGKTGRNFAAGMTGGVAYVLDRDETFPALCNLELVDLERIEDSEEADFVRTMIEKHQKYTGSSVAQGVLDRWDELLPKFIKIMPRDYKRALIELAAEAIQQKAAASDEVVATARS
jgi:glutamate synthase (ferredoxin)